MTSIVLAFIIGILIGAAIALVASQFVYSQAGRKKAEEIEKVLDHMKDSFKALSSDVLSQHSKDFINLASQTLSKQTQAGASTLDEKKKLIDQTLVNMKDDLGKVSDLVKTLEKDRESKFSELATQIKNSADQNQRLQEVTNKLQSVLVNNKARGDWGERMAEDVLRLAGFVEGINYKKQKELEAGGKRPDYSFILPQDLIVNMDVKFPMNNYLRYFAAEGEIEKKSYKEQFLRDVRGRIKEVTGRDYINPEDNTVDYVIVFIPNEQVYSFVNESDSTIIDEALKNKVIFCSPLTLYAILAVIRQAMDNFKLEKTAAEISGLLGAFYKQWTKFVDSMDNMGRKIDDAQREFQNLITTRRNQLERPLKKIEDLRVHKGIPLATEEQMVKELAE